MAPLETPQPLPEFTTTIKEQECELWATWLAFWLGRGGAHLISTVCVESLLQVNGDKMVKVQVLVVKPETR